MTNSLANGFEQAQPPPAKPRRRLSWLLLRGFGWIVLGFVVFCLTFWSGLAVYFTDLSGGAAPRPVMAIFVVLLMVASVLFLRPRKFRLVAFGAIFLIVLFWYFSHQPSNTRDWGPDVANTSWATIDGDRVTVHNVRNFDYRSETDFTPNWEDRTYDLSKIRSADYVLSYWGSKAIAHGIVSFGFEDGTYLAASIETRKEKGESYSAVQGFFRQYELIYIFADERDVLRVRTNYRSEDVYVYRTRVPPKNVRDIFLSYVKSANELHEKPAWYNALTTNCVTSIIPHAQVGMPKRRINWEILLAGYSARRAYRNGNLDDSMPFEELESRCRITDKAIAADRDPDFSSKIRVGLPIPKPATTRQTASTETN